MATDLKPVEDESYLRLAAWFLGPRAENQEEFHRILGTALSLHGDWRRKYFPQDPAYITQDVKNSKVYKDEIAKIEREVSALSIRLRNSQPFFSSRYKGHMNWDASMIGRLGYFAAALFNSNNVATEGAPVTTALEYEVAHDLCVMLGYNMTRGIKGPDNRDLPVGWGHIPSCGSNANTESLWAARNVKYLTPAIFKATTQAPEFAVKRDSLMIGTANGTKKKVIELDDWEQYNVPADEVLATQLELVQEFGDKVVTEVLNRYSVQKTGLYGQKPGVYMVPATRHYSWDKAGAVLGIGTNNMWMVNVDSFGRLDLLWFEEYLKRCLRERIPIFSVVAVVGTTAEGVVDPVGSVLALREKYRKLGLDFYLHADAAWGGYFCSTFERPSLEARPMLEGALQPLEPFVPTLPLSAYVIDQLKNHLPKVDSITIDPHKSGWIQYPAGGLCYRNENIRKLLAFEAPVIVPPGLPGATDPSIGVFGIEGSKPGASVAAVWLHHKVVGLNPKGHGRLCAEAHFTTKLIYATLATMELPDDPFAIALYQPLRPGLHELLRTRVIGRTNRQIMQDPFALSILSEIGPDLLINAFALNYSWPVLNYDAEGKVGLQRTQNRTLAQANKVLMKVADELNVSYQQVDSETIRKRGVARHGLFMIRNTLQDHQQAVKNQLQRALELDVDLESDMHYFVNSNMDPWPSATKFIPTVLEPELRNAILRGIGAVMEPRHLHGFVITNCPPTVPVGTPAVNELDIEVFGDHLPMFRMYQHQYHLVVKIAFKDAQTKAQAWQLYQQKLEEKVPVEQRDSAPFVIGNVNKSRLYELINGPDPEDNAPIKDDKKDKTVWEAELRCGVPGQWYEDAFMTTELVITDVVRNFHFDPRDHGIKPPQNPEYLLYGSGKKAYISHMMKAMPDYHYVAEVDILGEFSPLLLEMGVSVSINLDGSEDGKPLPEKKKFKAEYVGEAGAALSIDLEVVRNVWFDTEMLNTHDHDE
eukprot:TRINITY_DN3642_c0_g3_i1.p1 TRINITY_DN3642_c0_g3~~TRINITY_DN3642_c0_g3_i1.p1  ORF type:complete len:985 (+),score=379.04 TRINITY_DN3642_c0_g3_i1:102-3056(+)